MLLLEEQQKAHETPDPVENETLMRIANCPELYKTSHGCRENLARKTLTDNTRLIVIAWKPIFRGVLWSAKKRLNFPKIC